MSLKTQIQDDQKNALRAADKRLLGVLRLIMAAIKQVEIDQRKELTTGDVFAVLEKMIKQRRDSATQFKAAGRAELVAQEEFEIGVIQQYLPAPFSADEVAAMIDRALADSGATTRKEMGAVMAIFKDQLQGRADLGAVSKLILERLQG